MAWKPGDLRRLVGSTARAELGPSETEEQNASAVEWLGQIERGGGLHVEGVGYDVKKGSQVSDGWKEVSFSSTWKKGEEHICGGWFQLCFKQETLKALSHLPLVIYYHPIYSFYNSYDSEITFQYAYVLSFR